MFGTKHHSQDNQHAVTTSAILAKAVTRLPNGRYEVITVFGKSTRLEYYWVFQARSPRSPMRTWKLMGYFMRENHTYTDFGTFVAQRAQLHGAEVLTVRMPQKRRLTTLTVKTEHDSIYADWSPRDDVILIQDRLRRKGQNSQRAKAWLR